MTSSDRQYSEKRNYIRMYVNAELTFSFENATEKYPGHTLDLSGSGLRFETLQEVQESSKLSLALQSINGAVPPLNGTVEVNRVQKEGDKYIVSGEFHQIN
jgi:hypothetical protein